MNKRQETPIEKFNRLQREKREQEMKKDKDKKKKPEGGLVPMNSGQETAVEKFNRLNREQREMFIPGTPFKVEITNPTQGEFIIMDDASIHKALAIPPHLLGIGPAPYRAKVSTDFAMELKPGDRVRVNMGDQGMVIPIGAEGEGVPGTIYAIHHKHGHQAENPKVKTLTIWADVILDSDKRETWTSVVADDIAKKKEEELNDAARAIFDSGIFSAPEPAPGTETFMIREEYVDKHDVQIGSRVVVEKDLRVAIPVQENYGDAVFENKKRLCHGDFGTVRSIHCNDPTVSYLLVDVELDNKASVDAIKCETNAIPLGIAAASLSAVQAVVIRDGLIHPLTDQDIENDKNIRWDDMVGRCHDLVLKGIDEGKKANRDGFLNAPDICIVQLPLSKIKKYENKHWGGFHLWNDDPICVRDGEVIPIVEGYEAQPGDLGGVLNGVHREDDDGDDYIAEIFVQLLPKEDMENFAEITLADILDAGPQGGEEWFRELCDEQEIEETFEFTTGVWDDAEFSLIEDIRRTKELFEKNVGRLGPS